MKPPIGTLINAGCTHCEERDILPLRVNRHQGEGVKSSIAFRTEGHEYTAADLRHIAKHIDAIGETA